MQRQARSVAQCNTHDAHTPPLTRSWSEQYFRSILRHTRLLRRGRRVGNALTPALSSRRRPAARSVPRACALTQRGEPRDPPYTDVPCGAQGLCARQLLQRANPAVRGARLRGAPASAVRAELCSMPAHEHSRLSERRFELGRAPRWTRPQAGRNPATSGAVRVIDLAARAMQSGSRGLA